VAVARRITLASAFVHRFGVSDIVISFPGLTVVQVSQN
jgi:hypothetical protein